MEIIGQLTEQWISTVGESRHSNGPDALLSTAPALLLHPPLPCYTKQTSSRDHSILKPSLSHLPAPLEAPGHGDWQQPLLVSVPNFSTLIAHDFIQWFFTSCAWEWLLVHFFFTCCTPLWSSINSSYRCFSSSHKCICLRQSLI